MVRWSAFELSSRASTAQARQAQGVEKVASDLGPFPKGKRDFSRGVMNDETGESRRIGRRWGASERESKPGVAVAGRAQKG